MTKVKQRSYPITPNQISGRALTAKEFQQLREVPPEAEWFANIDNLNTRRAYQNDLKELMTFVGIGAPDELRLVARAHLIAWRKDLQSRGLASSTIRRKLAAVSSLYEYLCDRNAVAGNPTDGVRRPKAESHEGKTPALGKRQARQLLRLPIGEDVKARRDRALLSLLLHHGLRREELSLLKVQDLHPRRGVYHLRVHGKGGKVRNIPLYRDSQEAITAYLKSSKHAHDKGGPLFRPTRNNRTGELERPLSGDTIYKLVRGYAGRLGLAIGAHALRATAATNALDNKADIREVQEWLGHANIATTCLYDRRRFRVEDSPTFKVSY